MKISNLIVRILEPCHEDWNRMQPDTEGKFCISCSKSVFDFSNKTDTEIRDILVEYKDQKVCGHFKKSQVNRPLNISINLHDLPKNMSVTKAFAIALFVVFGTFLFSCTDNHGQKINEIEVVNKESEKYTIGMMVVDVPPPSADSIGVGCEIMTGESIMPADSVEKIFYDHSTISGGISYEEIPVVEVLPVSATKDSIIYEEPMVVGQMTMPFTESDSTVVKPKDTIVVENARKKEIKEATVKSSELVIYPNPSNGEFIIKYELLKRTSIRLDIFDTKGILIKTVVDVSHQHEGKYQIPVNLNELPNGIYLVNLIKNDRIFVVERLIIER